MNKIRVLIVEDSIFFRRFLIDGLSKYHNIEIAGFAANALEAGQRIRLLSPDVITLDIELPGMSGLDFLKKLLLTRPLPVILVSSLNLKLFDALIAGAVDFVKKPDSIADGNRDIFITSLYTRLLAASKAQVRLSGTAAKIPAVPFGNKYTNPPNPSGVIAIGASTGGTEAILSVLKPLPVNLPPIVITQHMPPGFTDMYAKRLNRLTALEVREARNGDVLSRGLALIAPGGLQMQLLKGADGYFVKCYNGPRVHGLAPSVDVLFNSAAEAAGKDAVGIILTGMGRDGADGLLHMKRKGAFTIGQDKESSVVYGMPREAYEAGAVCRQASLRQIPAMLMNYLTRPS